MTAEMNELEASHIANGKLAAECARLAARVAVLEQARRDLEAAYYEQKSRVRELEGQGAEKRLQEIQGKIASEERRLEAQVQRKQRAATSLRALESLTTKFVREALDITDTIGA